MEDESRQNIEEQVRRVLLAIIHRGILNCRFLGFRNKGMACAYEMDHIHNLPELMTNMTKEKLLYYCNVERKGYKRMKAPEMAGFDEFWDELDDLVGRF